LGGSSLLSTGVVIGASNYPVSAANSVINSGTFSLDFIGTGGGGAGLYVGVNGGGGGSQSNGTAPGGGGGSSGGTAYFGASGLVIVEW
jgi:hypothetical protein